MTAPHIRAHSTPARERLGDWMETFTGRKFWPLDPDPDEIDIIDIAWALGHICRFNGHARGFYSVAQHSVLVSTRCGLHLAEGLMHDAAEAYLGDIIRPMKRSLDVFYRPFEFQLERVIARKFGLTYPWPPAVKWMDEAVLQTEREFLRFRQPWAKGEPPLQELLEAGVELWPPERAAEMFLHQAVEAGVADPGDIERLSTEKTLRTWAR